MVDYVGGGRNSLKKAQLPSSLTLPGYGHLPQLPKATDDYHPQVMPLICTTCKLIVEQDWQTGFDRVLGDKIMSGKMVSLHCPKCQVKREFKAFQPDKLYGEGASVLERSYQDMLTQAKEKKTDEELRSIDTDKFVEDLIANGGFAPMERMCHSIMGNIKEPENVRTFIKGKVIGAKNETERYHMRCLLSAFNHIFPPGIIQA